MQDYKRAIVIGGNQTWGKGTVQNVFPLNRMVREIPTTILEPSDILLRNIIELMEDQFNLKELKVILMCHTDTSI